MQLAMLNDIGSEIAGVIGLDEVFERAAYLIHENFGYYNVAILTFEKSKEELEFRANVGELSPSFFEEKIQELHLRLNDWATQNKVVTVTNDFQKNSSYSISGEYFPFRSELSVPICQGETVVGVLDIHSQEESAFDESDILIMETLADQIAVAVERAQLYEAQLESSKKLRKFALYEQKAREEERKLITREIHDEIGQYLTVLKLNLEGSSHGNEEQLFKAQELVDQLITRVKNLALILRPSLLDDLGLVHAIQWLVENYQKQSGLKVKFQHHDLESSRFPAELEIAAYRIIQEALTNVVRHAETERASVGLLQERDNLRVQVWDSGIGFELEKTKQDQQTIGLISMQERVALLGGQLIVDSSPGEGTQVLAILPIKKKM